MTALLDTPLFGIFLSLAAYAFGVFVHKKTGLLILHPLLIALACVVGFLMLTGVPLSYYEQGGSIISMFLPAATASLALSIYRQRTVLRQNWLPVLVGTGIGALTSMLTTLLLCHLFGLEEQITVSLLPKSVTTPIAVALCEQAGGITAITVVIVMMTGVPGAIMAPYLIKWLKIEDPVIQGVAIGTASHAVGTAKAIEIGEVQGAMSGLSIGIAGVWTVLFALFLM
jgi:hypothetical protein